MSVRLRVQPLPVYPGPILALTGWRLLLGAGAGVVALACGPSFQAVYEGDVRFEHCYAIDQGPAAADAKKACWRDWLREDTYGQSRDRVEYAATRASELSLDPTLPAEDREAKHTHPLGAPVPTNAFAPPPNTIDHAQGAGESSPPATISAAAAQASVSARTSTGNRPPGEECSDGCADYWRTCHTSCKAAGCDACDKAYRLCVPGCFKK